jgi:ATP-dependent Clp protease adaptor protein ClpS
MEARGWQGLAPSLWGGGRGCRRKKGIAFFLIRDYSCTAMGTSFEYAVRKKTRFKEPSNFKVILLNDDYTSMDFVVEVIVGVFHKGAEEAEALMLDVHNKGRAVVGVYTKDIAETKIVEVGRLAAENDFPLKCIMEKA